MIMCVSAGTAIFVCASCAYFLLRAVFLARLHAVMALVVYTLLTIGADFIPGMLMVQSKAIWPFVFSGDQELEIFLAPLLTMRYLIPLLIAFVIGLVCCYKHKAKAID